MLSSLTDFLGAVINRAGIVLVLFALCLFQIARLDLLHAPAITFLTVMAAWLVLATTVATRSAPWAAVGAGLYLGWATFSGTLPGLAGGAREVVLSADDAARRSALELRTPRQLACDRTTASRQVFFTGTAPASAAMWFSVEYDGRIACWDRPGVHPRTGQALEPVTPEVVVLIGLQEPDTPAPPPAAPLTPPESPAPKRTDGFQPVVIR